MHCSPLIILCTLTSALADQSFSSFKDVSFFSTHQPSSARYSSPPQTAPSYSPPPAYPPSPSYPEPAYKTYEQPSHNCTVQDETIRAEVCTPSLVPSCGPVTLKGTKVTQRKKCFPITKTVCTQITEEATVILCAIKYEPRTKTAEATLLEVGFVKECSKQMVTVCEPQQHPQTGYGYNKGSYQHCKEIGQETCFNNPKVTPKTTQVEVKVPEPKQECGPSKVELPAIECEEVQEETCVNLPSVESDDVSAEQCTVDLGPPDCKPVDLVLPKQVCQEIIYGHASKPVYPPPPPPVHNEYNSAH